MSEARRIFMGFLLTLLFVVVVWSVVDMLQTAFGGVS